MYIYISEKSIFKHRQIDISIRAYMKSYNKTLRHHEVVIMPFINHDASWRPPRRQPAAAYANSALRWNLSGSLVRSLYWMCVSDRLIDHTLYTFIQL